MKPILALVVLAVLLFPTATIAEFGSPSYRCDATRKYYCVANEGCKQIPATTFARMNMQNRMYSRCIETDVMITPPLCPSLVNF